MRLSSSSSLLFCAWSLASTSTSSAFVPSVAESRSRRGVGRSTTTTELGGAVDALRNAAASYPWEPVRDEATRISREVVDVATDVLASVRADGLSLDAPSASVDEVVGSLVPLVGTPWHAGAVVVVVVGASLVRWIDAPLDFSEAPFEPGTDTYDPAKSDAFYRKRPLTVLRRVLQLASVSGAFGAGLLFDWLVLGRLLKDEEYTALRRNEPRRAAESLGLCERMGPTFIKLGQALSIRTDLLPEAYALELRALQDAVTPFDSTEAYAVLRRELGGRRADLDDVFSSLSSEPVASASIGQVYRGTLAADGRDVAVKVQRPGILAEIALDLHILRSLTPAQTILQNKINGVETDQADVDTALALVDEWGRGFVAETDYRLEADNTREFGEFMRVRGLDAVCAPAVVDDLVRDRVLVTEWVEGARLDASDSPDVPRLCGVAINAYLTMLLDTGVLHCDPHPGNLLRTTDGRLCVLDWGMTLRVPDDLQYALLEFIAHVNAEDYDAIPNDFINLGFSPPDVTPERLKSSGITEGLSFTFRQLSQGGGPKKIQERVKAEFQQRYGADLSDEELRLAARDEMMRSMEDQLAKEGVDVKGVTNVMEEMSRRNRELFRLPPYVLYVARAFSTLEGIGLTVDENYAIVRECYPYLARRLFTDRSPRARAALESMLGVGDGVDVSDNKGALSAAKLLEMSDGFASYTATAEEVDREGAGLEAAAESFADLFLDPGGSALADVLVEETARYGDAATRAALRAALVDSAPARAAASATRALRDLAPDAPLARRLADLPSLVKDLVAVDDGDDRVLDNARRVADALGPRLFPSSGNGRLADVAADGALGVPSPPPLVSLEFLADAEKRDGVAKRLPGAAALGRRVGAGLLRRAAWRTRRTTAIPEAAREFLADANAALARTVDMDDHHYDDDDDDDEKN